MKGDVALAGFVFSAQDWASFEATFRAELMAAASVSAPDPWVVGLPGELAQGSGPMRKSSRSRRRRRKSVR
jgi:hypothetical protein